jgi:hypothetical protein
MVIASIHEPSVSLFHLLFRQASNSRTVLGQIFTALAGPLLDPVEVATYLGHLGNGPKRLGLLMDANIFPISRFLALLLTDLHVNGSWRRRSSNFPTWRAPLSKEKSSSLLS